MSNSKRINEVFVENMKRIAEELGKPADEITKAQFLSRMEELNEWDLRKSGGFNNLKAMHFIPEDNLEVKYGSRMLRQHVNKIEKKYGQVAFFEKELVAAVKECLKQNPLKLHPPINNKKPTKKTTRTIVAAISDTHFGTNILKEEMHGVNEFNWTVAARRLALYVDQIVSYKPQHRKDTDLLIQLNGDIIAGQIHNQEWHVDLLTTQFVGTVHLLSQAISYAARHFPKVKVVCTPGNHGRNVGKADRGRATVQKWDSYENMIYASLKEILTSKHKNVEFLIPESPLVIYKVQGHNVCQTHGDTTINVGNPGNSINMQSISNQVNNLNNSDLVAANERVAVLSVGHVHVPTVQILQNGCVAVINGCLSGTDPFAQSIGIFSNNPTQTIFEATEEHAVGDIRMIQVKSADKEAKFDKIVEPFKGKF